MYMSPRPTRDTQAYEPCANVKKRKGTFGGKFLNGTRMTRTRVFASSGLRTDIRVHMWTMSLFNAEGAGGHSGSRHGGEGRGGETHRRFDIHVHGLHKHRTRNTRMVVMCTRHVVSTQCVVGTRTQSVFSCAHCLRFSYEDPRNN